MLSVHEVSRVFTGPGGAEIRAVENVSFELQKGRALGVIGESGSGKTTLAKIILGLERASTGTVEIDGKAADTSGRPARRKPFAAIVQVVFQDPSSSLDPLQTVGSMLSEVLKHHRRQAPSTEELVALLASVGLPAEMLERRPRALSGGQRQRVAIARALAPDPELLVLDEAVSALDVSVQAQVLNLLNAIRRERQLSLLFITHDIGVVRQSCDDVLVMHRGKVVEQGTVAQVFDDPRNDYTRSLRAAVPSEGWNPAAVSGIAEV
jgi:ABC-type glutathione transport system ATPase component